MSTSFVIHTSDWHFGATSYIPDNLERQFKAIELIFKTSIAISKRLGSPNRLVMVVSGDVFHHHFKVEQKVKDRLLEFLLKIDKLIDFHCFFIEGNHSHSTDYSNLLTFEILEKKGKFEKMHFSSLSPRIFPMKSQTLFLIPNTVNTTTDYYSELLERLISTSEKEGFRRPYIFLMHELFDGVTVNGRKLRNRRLKFLKEWEGLGDYFALGDIHDFCKVSEKAYYCGSPIQHTVGESLPKGFLLVKVKAKSFPSILKFYKLSEDNPNSKIKPILKVKSDDPKDIPDWAYVVLETSKPFLNFPDNVVKVVPILNKRKTKLSESSKSALALKDSSIEKLLVDYVKEKCKEVEVSKETLKRVVEELENIINQVLKR